MPLARVPDGELGHIQFEVCHHLFAPLCLLHLIAIAMCLPWPLAFPSFLLVAASMQGSKRAKLGRRGARAKAISTDISYLPETVQERLKAHAERLDDN